MEFLRTVARFQNLQVLTLVAHSSLDMDPSVILAAHRRPPIDAESTDPEYDCAWSIIRFLHASKSGKRMETIRIIIKDCEYEDLWFVLQEERGVENPVPEDDRMF